MWSCSLQRTGQMFRIRKIRMSYLARTRELGAIGDQNDLFLGGSYRHYKSSRTVLLPPCLTLGWALGLECRGAVMGDTEYARHIGP